MRAGARVRAAIAGIHLPSSERTVVALEAVSEVGPGLAQAERSVQRTITFNGKKSRVEEHLATSVLRA
jgi:hypothetical protein